MQPCQTLTLAILLAATAGAQAVQSPPAATRPVAVIDGWSNGSELAPEHSAAAPVVLEAGHPELVLFFHAEGEAKKPARLRYRLSDFAETWTETDGHTAHFWQLPPGTYSFQVQAAAAAGGWSGNIATFQIEQRPFFYQTWYAGVLVCAFVVAVGIQLLRQRDQLLKGQIGVVLEERNRIASDCHDTLMAGLAAVSWQMEATEQSLTADLPPEHPATSSLQLARSMLAHCRVEARRIIWDLRNGDRMADRLSDALADALSVNGAEGRAETTFTVQGEEVELSPTAVHHLTCIGQEALMNALRHGAPTCVKVELQFDAESLCLTVCDDGCGFVVQDTPLKAGHFGIPVMEERTRKLGGNFHLTSVKNVGTEVKVEVDLGMIHRPSVRDGAVVPWIGL